VPILNERWLMRDDYYMKKKIDGSHLGSFKGKRENFTPRGSSKGSMQISGGGSYDR